jgi:hypothetical protein
MSWNTAYDENPFSEGQSVPLVTSSNATTIETPAWLKEGNQTQPGQGQQAQHQQQLQLQHQQALPQQADNVNGVANT